MSVCKLQIEIQKIAMSGKKTLPHTSESSEKRMSARQRRRQSKDKEKNPWVFIVGAAVIIAICGPYIYYAIILNRYGASRIPAGYNWPKYSELHKTLIWTVACQTIRQLMHWSLRPLGMWLSKEQDDQVV